MKEEKYKAYLTEAGYLLFENGKNSFEMNGNIRENVEVSKDAPLSKDDKLVGNAVAVYGVVGKNNEVLTEQLPFYFQKNYAKSAAQQMNRSVVEKKKPYKVKKAFLFYPL